MRFWKSIRKIVCSAEGYLFVALECLTFSLGIRAAEKDKGKGPSMSMSPTPENPNTAP
jgi:hypothetical protein